MNARQVLKNPIAVIALGIGAAVMIAVNVVLPLFSNDIPAPESPRTQALLSAPAPVDSTPNAASAATAQAAPAANPNSLRIIGWRISLTRDPFKPGTGRPVKAALELPEDASPSPGSPAPSPRQPSPRGGTARTAAVRPPAAPSLQAIMQGPAGKSALIGGHLVSEGDTCAFGVVKKITTNTVILTTSRGSRELRLADRDRGDKP